MSDSQYTASLQQIRRVVPRDKPSVNTSNSARQNGGGNDQCKGSPCILPDACPYKDWRITNKIRIDQSTLIDKWECSGRGIKPWRRPTQTPRSVDDVRRLHVTNRTRVCATAQPRWLTSKHGERPRTSAQNWKVPTKPSAVSQLHRHGQSFDESDHHGGGTSLPVLTGGLVDRFRTIDGTHHDTTYFLQIQGDQRDRPQG